MQPRAIGGEGMEYAEERTCRVQLCFNWTRHVFLHRDCRKWLALQRRPARGSSLIFAAPKFFEN
jgi:hypothetical protein